MSQTEFSRRLRAAIESRRPLDDLASPDEELTSAEEREWHRQIILDQVIGQWLANENAPADLEKSGGDRRSRGAVAHSSRMVRGGRVAGLVALAAIVLLLGVPGPPLPDGGGILDLSWDTPGQDVPRILSSQLPSPTVESHSLIAAGRSDAPVDFLDTLPLDELPPLELAPGGEASELLAGHAASDLEWRREADRLVYAFEPVGDGVSAVWHRLVEAVPGVDVIAAWHYET